MEHKRFSLPSKPCQAPSCNERAAFSAGTQWTYCQRHLKQFGVGPYYRPRQGTSLADVSPDLTDWVKPESRRPKQPVDIDEGIFHPKYGPIPLRYIHPSKPVMMSEHESNFREQERLAHRRVQLQIKADWRDVNKISLKDKKRSGHNAL